MLEGTHPRTGWAGLLGAQLLGLLVGCGFQGAAEQATHGGHGDLFHFVEIDVQARPLLAPVTTGDDLSPPLG